jgi:hypothetical protein
MEAQRRALVVLLSSAASSITLRQSRSDSRGGCAGPVGRPGRTSAPPRGLGAFARVVGDQRRELVVAVAGSARSGPRRRRVGRRTLVASWVP